jgi:ABC-type transport system involved in cytochrome c biogenesis permease subunit
LDKHRVIIGWLFEAVTMFLAVFVAFTWKKAFGSEGSFQEQQAVIYAVTVAVLFLAVGLTLLLNYRRAYWVCLPFSVMMLVYFPLGTALGGYYLWYFWKFIYKRKPG